MLTIDARCDCKSCKDRTQNVYRMVGHCTNCGQDDILVLYREGDRAVAQDCPVCGNWRTVRATRLATPGEVPNA